MVSAWCLYLCTTFFRMCLLRKMKSFLTVLDGFSAQLRLTIIFYHWLVDISWEEGAMSYLGWFSHCYLRITVYLSYTLISSVELWSFESTGCSCSGGSNSEREGEGSHRCIPPYQPTNYDAWPRTTADHIQSRASK